MIPSILAPHQSRTRFCIASSFTSAPNILINQTPRNAQFRRRLGNVSGVNQQKCLAISPASGTKLATGIFSGEDPP